MVLAQLEEAYTGYDSKEKGKKTIHESIANRKVKKPAAWTRAWDKEKERFETVTRVTATQVHYITDNGVETCWRAPNNVERVSTK